MGRQYDTSGTQILSRSGGSPVTAVPLTLSCWCWVGANGVEESLVNLRNSASTSAFAVQRTTTGAARVRINSGAGTATATTATTAPVGAWSHFCATFTTTTSRSVFLNGFAKATNTTSRTPSGITVTEVGLDISSGDIIAFPAIWNVVLTDGEILQLAQGADPRTIRPQNLVAFWPLNTPGSTVEYDHNPFKPRRYDLTVTGATPAIDPPIWTPKRKRFFIPSLSVTGNRRRRVICGSAS